MTCVVSHLGPLGLPRFQAFDISFHLLVVDLLFLYINDNHDIMLYALHALPLLLQTYAATIHVSSRTITTTMKEISLVHDRALQVSPDTPPPSLWTAVPYCTTRHDHSANVGITTSTNTHHETVYEPHDMTNLTDETNDLERKGVTFLVCLLHDPPTNLNDHDYSPRVVTTFHELSRVESRG
jgi:hypothetical protein